MDTRIVEDFRCRDIGDGRSGRLCGECSPPDSTFCALITHSRQFLAFFRMAIKFLFVASILAGVVLWPLNCYYESGNTQGQASSQTLGYTGQAVLDDGKKPIKGKHDPTYLWASLVSVYVFTGLVYYFLWDQTREVVRVRQRHLGNQSTVTSRTIKLSGIPENLRSEGTLKEYLEKLGIGKVENITICRQWKELDLLLDKRQNTLRKLEEAHTVHHTATKKPRDLAILQAEQAESMVSDEEAQPLMEGAPRRLHSSVRPQITKRYGRFKLRSKRLDAIDYLTEKLLKLDGKITEARRKEYRPTPLAFVTLDSVAAAQIAMQTLLDPAPGALIARQAPYPSDINWHNVYLSRTARLWRGWSISISVTLLSVFWLIPVAALAGLLNMEEIRRVWPALADVLEANEALGSLVETFLPTLVLTLLNVAVPYFYDCGSPWYAPASVLLLMIGIYRGLAIPRHDFSGGGGTLRN